MTKIKKGFTHVLVLLIMAVVGVGAILYFLAQSMQSITPISTIVNHEACDLDWDKDCDNFDIHLFERSLGECTDTGNYNELADADHDGCVTENDEWLLYKQKTPKPLAASNQSFVYTPEWILEKGNEYIIGQVGKEYFERNFIFDSKEAERLNYNTPPNP